MEWSKAPGSFRDPSGFVFSHGGAIYRQVNLEFAEPYRRFIGSGLYEELAHDGLIVEHEEVDLRVPDAPPAFAVLRPERIPFISYPYEWCFSQYKAAALLTLELQKRALARGHILRDASAYNVQFIGSKAVFIDTLSFGPYVDGRPWAAYRQFCQHFLSPLALMALVHPSLGQLTRVHIDGVPLDVARRLLPFSSFLRPGLVIHTHLHGRSRGGSATATGAAGMSKTALLGLVDSLERTVRQMTVKPQRSLWATYPEHWNYTMGGQEHKQRIVDQYLELVAARSHVRTVWDLGANTGSYSLIAKKTADLVVGFDFDHSAVENHFQTCSARGEAGILPLVQDLANPSSGVGWNHIERQSLVDRGPADVAVALAVIHHLVLACNVPLNHVVAFLSRICRYLVIEFVPKEDSQVQRMMALRDHAFEDYSQKSFEESFNREFRCVRTTQIEGSLRTVYLMERRDT